MMEFTADNLKERQYSSYELIDIAQRWLHNEYYSEDAIKALAKELLDQRQFSFARRLYEQLLLDEKSRWDEQLVRNLAQATYQDDELPSDRRFDAAANLLIGRFSQPSDGKSVDARNVDPDKLDNQEVLGLLGAIYKRKWKLSSQLTDLFRSLAFYRRGYDIWLKDKTRYDQFYTAINAAYVYDLLAVTLRSTISNYGESADSARGFTEKADAIRRTIIAELTQRIANAYNYWEAVTLAEAYIGQGKAPEADLWLKHSRNPAAGAGPTPRERETTAYQLAELAQLRFPDEEATYCDLLVAIEDFLMDNQGTASYQQNAAKPRFGDGLNRKIGLALSGGGFRASLFHIGVLAKLAELDLLRHIQVISCVSGGSIIGAYYYLELQKILEEKTDSEITPGDYAVLVRRIADQFLERINGNLRIEALSNPLRNLKIALFPGYTRTTRMGELYESELYSKVFDYEARERKRKYTEERATSDLDRRMLCKAGDRHIYMDDLRITPKAANGEPDRSFNPRRDNWKRLNKVPVLVLNATTLNTGHNWQFTASFMGEAPGSISKELSAMPVFRRMYYWEAPPAYRKIKLGTAVGASSCVPALFAPVQFPDLFPDQRIQLVDGGVHDNQGATALLQDSCDTLIISDASGQLTPAASPPSSEFGVFFRSDTILQERLRDSQFQALFNHAASGSIKGFLLMHLTKGLKSESLEWERCTDLYPSDGQAELQAKKQLYTPYGIRSSIQQRLALIRTDLDCFHQAEAYALMYSGYRMTETEYGQKGGEAVFPQRSAEVADQFWPFMKMEEYNRDDDKTARLEKLLNASAELFLKPYLVSDAVRLRTMTFLGILAILVAALLFKVSFLQIGLAIVVLALVGAAIWFSPALAKVARATGNIVGTVWGAIVVVFSTLLLLAVMLLMTIPHYLYKLLLNRWYLRAGTILAEGKK